MLNANKPQSKAKQKSQAKHNRKQEFAAKHSGEYWDNHAPPEELYPYSTIFMSHTVNPYSSNEVYGLLDAHTPGVDVFLVDPKRIRTMHAGIADTFANGSKIDDTVEQLRKDPQSAKHLPPINLAAVEVPVRKWETHGAAANSRRQVMLFTEDHRRLVAARKAGITAIPAQFKSTPVVTGNFTTKNNGESMEIRHYSDKEQGLHQTRNVSTFPSSGSVYRYLEE